MRHTFGSSLIRCANMKWILWVLLKIQSGYNFVHRRTDGQMDRQTDEQGETSIPPFQLRGSGVYTYLTKASQIARFMGPTWGPPGTCRPQMGPMNHAIRLVVDVRTLANDAMIYLIEYICHELQSGGPFHEQFFHHNSNSMKTPFYTHPSCSDVIAMNFFTRHNNYAVMACTKFCSDTIPCNGVILKPIFHWI